jgi:integrase
MTKEETCIALKLVPDLKEGRTKAVEYPDVKQVPDEWIEKTLPFLPSVVQAMLRLQRLTGMRPGEVRAMRLCDIDMSRDVWLYIPWEHKTEHHGIPRYIALGPECQSVLTPYLMDKEERPEDWLFNPREAIAERKAKSGRSRSKSKSVPNKQFTAASYWLRIRQSAEKAGVPHWFPNQIRHTALTAIRAKEGLEAAQVIAGHKNTKMTEIYAEKDITRVIELARKYA